MVEEVLEKPFCLSWHVVPGQKRLMKAETDANGDWVLSGPIKQEGPDYEDQILPDTTLWKGLTFFEGFGNIVDWMHLFVQTKSPKWIIGRGKPFKGPDGHPWCATKLFKGKSAAQECWEHFDDPEAPGGYSIDGVLRMTDNKDKRILAAIEVHRMTIDPSPLHWGNFIQKGVPVGSIVSLSKGLKADLSGGRLDDLWRPAGEWGPVLQSPILPSAGMNDVQEELDSLRRQMRTLQKALRAPRKDAKDPADREECPHCGANGERGDDGHCNRCGKPWPAKTRKALLAGAGVVQPGATGGAALRGQNLQSSEQCVCPHCGCKNRMSRTHCRKCGKPLGKNKPKEGALIKALAARGVANPVQVARIILQLRGQD